MKNNLILSVMLAVCTIIALPSYAKGGKDKKHTESDKNRNFIFLTGNNTPDDVKDVTEIFHETQSPYFQDPRAPRFILMDRKNRVAFGIGGYIKTTVSYDFAGIANNVDFVTYDIPVPKSTTDRSQFQMDASTSRLFFKLVGNNKYMKKFTAYIETDFRGNNYALHLRQAYISFRGVLIGQSWSTFTDLASIPPTVDFEGPSAATELRNVQVRYTINFKKRWQFAAAIENPGINATLTNNITTAKQRCPDIPFYLQYEWNNNSHVRLTGLLRGMRYNDLVEDKNRSVFGWGVQLSGMASITDKWTLYYQATYGEGIAKYINDLSGSGYDLLPSDNGGKLKAPSCSGFIASVQYNFMENLFVSASYSYNRIYDSNISYNPELYKQAQYVSANIFWTVANNWQFGAEYLFGERKNQDDKSAIANRFQLMAQYNF
ncbi:MAG: DcaP family trimeric outer membrane transporter [Bacteroidales bacterium]